MIFRILVALHRRKIGDLGQRLADVSRAFPLDLPSLHELASLKRLLYTYY